MRVPMTTFSTFVTASPASKISCVQTFKAGYDPRHDFYKQLRETIPKNHQDANTPAALKAFLGTVRSPRKIGNYNERVTAYLLDRANVMLRLLELGYGRIANPVRVAVLDVLSGRLIEPTSPLAYLDPVLAGEAASFNAMFAAL